MGLPKTLEREDLFSEARMNLEDLIDWLKSSDTAEQPHSEVERELKSQGRELLRKLFQTHLESRGSGESSTPVHDADGDLRKPTRLHERTLSSIFGTVNVRRVGYGKEGSRSLHPLDGELNLPVERYSHEMRRQIAIEVAKGSYEETGESLLNQTGTRVPKRQLEELAVRAAQDFERFYQQRSIDAVAPVEENAILAMSFDGKGIVVHHEDLREDAKKKAEKRKAKAQQEREKPYSKNRKLSSKRMAEVATVYFTKPFVRTPEQIVREVAPIHEKPKGKRPQIKNKRVWASLKKSPEEVIAQAFEEAQKRDPDHGMQWIVLVDGNKSQLKIINKLAKRHKLKPTILLDFIHVCQYVWEAAAVFNEDKEQRGQWVSKMLLKILQGKSASVAAKITETATRQEFSPEEREAADRCVNYLTNNRKYLRYKQALEAGFPIATGVIEGACRHLVKDRMEITGARWRLTGAEAVLRLRALRSSADFDEYWAFHEQQEYQRNHAEQYARNEVPATRNPLINKKTRLKIVK